MTSRPGQTATLHSRKMSNSSTSSLVLCVLTAFVAACGPSSSRNSSTEATGVVDGKQKTVIVDPNQGGTASTLRIEEVFAGRLVDIYDTSDPAPQFEDFLIGEQVVGDGVNFVLATDPITQRAEVTILADATTEPDKFDDIFRTHLADSASSLVATSTSPAEVPPFPLVPRNAAVAVRFSDLLDHSTINASTVRLSVGNPPLGPFNARVIPDPNHGAFTSGVFHTSRVILDTTVSEFESSGGTLPLNGSGLPPSLDATAVNAAVRVPSVLNASVGQFKLLRNVGGKSVSTSNDPLHENNSTLDVVRAFRTGSPADANNGFLRDDEPPVIRGVQSVSIPGAQCVGVCDPLDPTFDPLFLATIDFAKDVCAVTPDVGDLLVLTGSSLPQVFAEVVVLAAPPQSGTASDVLVRMIFAESATTQQIADFQGEFTAGSTSGRFEATFRPGPGVVPACFFEISPPPGTSPATGVSTAPRISLRFSEPIDPDSILPFDNLRLDRVTTDPPLPDQIVIGEVTPTPDLREFRYQPLLDLNHTQGTAETYFLNLVGGLDGVTDLAGNPLAATFPDDVPITLDPNFPTKRTGGIALRFSRVNEFGNVAAMIPVSEIRGQFERDVAGGFITARKVTRMQQVVDMPTTATFNYFPTLVPTLQQTPLHQFGSRMMTVWRYCDVGFGLVDETTSNIDIEGLSWAPTSTQVSADFFPQFEISLSHSSRLPDEFFLASGLVNTFADNVLVDPDNAKKIVHPRSRGYLLDPQQVFTTSSGTLMLPYPLNRGVPVEEFQYYTWRDTAILGTGGPDGAGAEVLGFLQTAFNGFPNAPCLTVENTVPSGMMPPVPPTVVSTLYPAGAVRSLGLPLLMDFKCFATPSSPGLNFPTGGVMAGTFFRVYSTGGHDAAGLPVQKNPDTELTGSGTFNGSTANGVPLGTLFPGSDSISPAGRLDVVVRVSRVHTRWFATGASALGFPDYSDPVIEPRPDQQPAGTSVTLAFRGADSVTNTDTDPDLDFEDASKYDEYGDPFNMRIFLDNDQGTCLIPDDDTFTVVTGDFSVTGSTVSWKKDIDEIDGSRFFQVRITFVSNTSTLLRPTLSTLAIPFRQG